MSLRVCVDALTDKCAPQALSLGTLVYNANYKSTPYVKLLLRAQLWLAALSLLDWTLVTQVEPSAKTVLGMDAHMFALLSEGIISVTERSQPELWTG
jgi:hypothetical protein